MMPLRTLEDFLHLGRSALIVYDMQVGILSQLPHGTDVLSRVLTLVDLARRCSLPVFYLRHLSLPKKLMGQHQMRQAMATCAYTGRIIYHRVEARKEGGAFSIRSLADVTPAFRRALHKMLHGDEVEQASELGS